MTVAVTRVVNACALVDVGGAQVLTDPCFAAPLGFRFDEPVGVRVVDLPRLAAIVVGHRVPDHWQPARNCSDGATPARSATFASTACRASGSPGCGRTPI